MDWWIRMILILNFGHAAKVWCSSRFKDLKIENCRPSGFQIFKNFKTLTREHGGIGNHAFASSHKTIFSVVVAFTDTSSLVMNRIDAMISRISSAYFLIFGASRQTESIYIHHRVILCFYQAVSFLQEYFTVDVLEGASVSGKCSADITQGKGRPSKASQMACSIHPHRCAPMHLFSKGSSLHPSTGRDRDQLVKIDTQTLFCTFL